MTRNEKTFEKMKNRAESEPQHLVVWEKIKNLYFTGKTFPIDFLSGGKENAGKI